MGRRFLNGVHPDSGVVLTVAGIRPDQNGNTPGMAGDGWSGSIAAADTANTTTTGVNTDIAIPAGLTPGNYAVDGIIIAVSAAITTGVQLAITAATGATPALRWTNPASTTTEAFAFDRTGGTWHATTAAPYAAGTPWPIQLDGIITVTTTTTTPMTVQVRSEVASSEARVKAGSYLTWRRIDTTAIIGTLPATFYTGDA